MRDRLNRRAIIAVAAGGLLLPVSLSGAARAISAPSAPAATAACSDGGWVGFQHDQSHTGTGCGAITTANVSTLVPGWFVPTSNAVTAEPAVVGNTVYLGDNGGIFHAIDAKTGTQKWTFDVTKYDHHATSNGVITSSATYTNAIGKSPAVIFGGGGSVFALDASSGAMLWRTDLAPKVPTGPDEVESSPVVVPRANGTAEILVGLDTNESTDGISGGLVALNANAQTGEPLWTFEPDSGKAQGGLPTAPGNGCNDVWSSPAVDVAAGLVFFGTGNCPDGHGTIEAVSIDGGTPVWHFDEPKANHGTDDDFGSSPMLATEPDGQRVVVEGGKSGWVYVLGEFGKPAGDGTVAPEVVNSAQVAQPGQTGDDFAGAIGGFIGAMALTPVNGDPVVFGNSAIPAPFTGDGITSSGVTPDTSLATDPTRASSLHAYDTATGKVLWQEPLEAPSYAPVTAAGGVVFAPSTTGFSLEAYNAATGAPLWAFPLAASASGGVAVVGSSIFFGAGTYDTPQAQVPPQATGIWMFHLAGS